ncbi:putative metal-dependent hydrolase [Ereboglobus sp. PH5-10]|uniref:M48 family metallopeptidase n=1 Tax=Ereboglobus sp. PH5-10 TaxID=2940629 RepID=UPI0024076E95|nr:SprT family zinc-dependent metalloprotease [Ereboglobus sp. PH5-10]MDF9828201.1 putative metal-dependent hydrolase [Ereboglobus sp. PH5-10]
MPPEIQLDLFGLFTPASGVHKSPPNGPAPSSFFPPAGDTAASSEIVYVRSPRARHYRLTLRRDGSAVVTIPSRGSEREARRFAADHADWLARARARQEKKPRAATTWGVGTRILWRGEMTAVRVAHESTAERPAVAIGADNIGAPGIFRVASLASDLRPTLEAHFLRIAKVELPARTWELAAETRVPVTRVTVRNQRTRWGSCTADGIISLNWRLVQAPVFVRDYIIYHELMHLREMNHSARFWARVAEVCPWWRDAERWIKQNGGLLGL